MDEVIKNTLVLVPQNMIEKEIPGISTIEVEVKKDSRLPMVRLGKDLCNYFNEERNGFISRECFKNAEEFINIEAEKYAIVQRLNFAWNILKSDGSFLSKDEDFKEVCYSSSLPFIVVRKNEKFNLLKLDGRFVSPNEDFLQISTRYQIKNMVLVIRVNGCYNFLGADGSFLESKFDFIRVNTLSSEFKFRYYQNYDSLPSDLEDCLKVTKSDSTVNILKSDGSYINQNEDFLEIKDFNSKYITFVVKRKNGLYNFLRFDGTLVSPNEDFLDSDIIFRKSKVRVRRKASGKYNYLKSDGTFKYKRDKMFLIPCDVFGN